MPINDWLPRAQTAKNCQVTSNIFSNSKLRDRRVRKIIKIYDSIVLKVLRNSCDLLNPTEGLRFFR